MRCPIDGETLVMADRSGVEIDYCPKCRGVWLDRGELDKIIERAAGGAPMAASAAPAAPPARDPGPVYQPEPRAARRDEPRRYRDDDDDDDYHRGHKRKRRDSFLSDLFDF
jgi:Zn-finger nucleic acid-binding protein